MTAKEVIRRLTDEDWYELRDRRRGRQMVEYTVIFEEGDEGDERWGAYVPDLPGCVTTGDTIEETRANIKEAIEGYIGALRSLGRPVPAPRSQVDRVAVAA